MIKLRYDLITAHKCGETEHPQKVLQDLGYNLLSYEGVPIGDCVLVEVEKPIEPLPAF